MPQIDQIASIYASQLFWLALVFALIYFGIGRAMLPRIQGNVDAREARIAGDLAEAERARAEATRADEAYQDQLNRSRAEAAAAAARAQAEAASFAEKHLRAADEEAAGKLHAAEQALAARTAQAEAEIDTIAADAVQQIVAKVAGLQIDRAVAAQAVRQAA